MRFKKIIFNFRKWFFCLICCMMVCPGFIAQSTAEVPARKEEIEDANAGWLDIVELTRIRIITASRIEQPVQETAAAVAVITGEDIRRSGVTNIPEALRLAPGTDVQRINSNRYAVTIRGFNFEFADKLLVLMDGRSVYTPQFSGVFWDMQDTVLEDIGRIEVVRGPGGTAWGANAFNGVVNVVSKPAQETQGLLSSGSLGSFDQSRITMRYGGKSGEHTWYRVFAQESFHGETLKPDGSGQGDDWNSFLGGFRIDSEVTSHDSLTVLGGVNYAELLQYSHGNPENFPAFGANLLGRWQHVFNESSKLETQLYYDAVRRDMLQNPVNTDTVDFDISHILTAGSTHRIHWGLNYRIISSRTENTEQHIFDPREKTIQQGGLLIEDQFSLVPDILVFSAGCKLEYYSLSGWEPLPNARLTWTPNNSHTIWASFSRGVRAPNTSDLYLKINTPYIVLLPNDNLRTEEVLAYQAGYRGNMGNRFGFDFTGFLNDYSHLTTLEQKGMTMPSTVQNANNLEGQSWGFEAALTWQSFDWWRWRANYTYLKMDPHTVHGSTNTSATLAEERSPKNQALLWWSFQPLDKLDLDVLMRYTDTLEERHIPAYWGLDMRIAYRFKQGIELAIVGQNLLDKQHQEFTRSPGFPSASEIPSSVYGKLTMRF